MKFTSHQLAGYKSAFEALGADLVGFSRVKDYGNIEKTFPKQLSLYTTAVTLGVKLSSGIIEEITDSPTPEYFANYRQANFKLDRLAYEAARLMENDSFLSYPVPASQITDWTSSRGLLSHKVFAYLSGLAFWGINNLAVSPLWGARVRWVTVLTTFEVEPAAMLENDYCEGCGACVNVCPAHAISKEKSKFDISLCKAALDKFIRERKTSQHICGICVKACRAQSVKIHNRAETENG